MELRILGCHGGASERHRQVSFLLDGRLALDAGSLAGTLSIEAQRAVEAVLVSHAHVDHVADLGPLTDLRCQQGGPTLRVAGLEETLDALRRHVFNDLIWPDFTRIPAGDGPALELRALRPEEPASAAGFEVLAVRVDHSVPAAGFLVRDAHGTIAYSGDTGPTRRFWELAGQRADLRAVITEVSYPDAHAELALRTGHLTPALLALELDKLRREEGLPVLVYGLKPLFEEDIRAELAALDLAGVRVPDAGERLRLG